MLWFSTAKRCQICRRELSSRLARGVVDAEPEYYCTNIECSRCHETKVSAPPILPKVEVVPSPGTVSLAEYRSIVEDNAKLREWAQNAFQESCRIKIHNEQGLKGFSEWLNVMPEPPELKAPPSFWNAEMRCLVKGGGTVGGIRRKRKLTESQLREYVTDLESRIKQFEVMLRGSWTDTASKWLESYRSWVKNWASVGRLKLMRYLQGLDPDPAQMPTHPIDIDSNHIEDFRKIREGKWDFSQNSSWARAKEVILMSDKITEQIGQELEVPPIKSDTNK